MDFKNFNKRNYAVISAREGYGEWANTYESSVPDLLDIQVLKNLKVVNWSMASQCLDLACGTGRTGQWLIDNGVNNIDGIDITPEMLEKAEKRGIYSDLKVGSVESTDLPKGHYDLLVMCLVDEHLSDLLNVYKEAQRLSSKNSTFVVVGMHPFFFMNGMPTHFDGNDGQPKAIETNIHLMSDHFNAAKQAKWNLHEMYEGVIDDEWLQVKPKWKKFKACPINFGYVWRN